MPLPISDGLSLCHVSGQYRPNRSPSDSSPQYARVEVEVHGGPVDHAWAYVYRGPMEELGPPIEGGDWVTFARSDPKAS